MHHVNDFLANQARQKCFGGHFKWDLPPVQREIKYEPAETLFFTKRNKNKLTLNRPAWHEYEQKTSCLSAPFSNFLWLVESGLLIS